MWERKSNRDLDNRIRFESLMASRFGCEYQNGKCIQHGNIQPDSSQSPPESISGHQERDTGTPVLFAVQEMRGRPQRVSSSKLQKTAKGNATVPPLPSKTSQKKGKGS